MTLHHAQPERISLYRPHRNSPGQEMSEEKIERLRATHPDDPVPLPEHHLACPGCGQAVKASPPVPLFSESDRMALGWGTDRRTWFARCADCEAIHVQAEAYTGDHPGLVARYGTVVREHIEVVLLGLRVIDKPTPDDLGFCLPRLLTASASIRFRSPLAVRAGLCNPRPWSHVSLRARAGLLKGYTEVLADRHALSAPAVPIWCPTRGCALCGIDHLLRSAIEVRRRGGPEITAVEIWTSVGSGDQRGHACPPCAEAVADEGALGPSAMNRAVLAHVRRESPEKATRLSFLLTEGATLPWWGSLPTPRVANSEPFEHVKRAVLDRL